MELPQAKKELTMGNELFGDRRKSLEEEFFRRQDAALSRSVVLKKSGVRRGLRSPQPRISRMMSSSTSLWHSGSARTRSPPYRSCHWSRSPGPMERWMTPRSGRSSRRRGRPAGETAPGTSFSSAASQRSRTPS